MTKEELHRQVTLGQRARAILTDEIVVEARRLVREDLLTAWEKSKPSDVDGRERTYLALKMFDRVWEVVERTLQDGKVADSQLPENERRGLLNL